MRFRLVRAFVVEIVGANVNMNPPNTSTRWTTSLEIQRHELRVERIHLLLLPAELLSRSTLPLKIPSLHKTKETTDRNISHVAVKRYSGPSGCLGTEPHGLE